MLFIAPGSGFEKQQYPYKLNKNQRIENMRRLIYDGDSVYEIDPDCLRKKEELERKKEMEWQKQKNSANNAAKKKKIR